VLAIAVIGYVVALVEPPTVFDIVIFATSVLGSAFLPAFVCAVWWRRANTAGALSSMIVGAAVAFSWEYFGLVASTQMHPMFTGVLCSSVTMVIVSLVTQKLVPVPRDVIDAIDECARLGPVPADLAATFDAAMTHEASAIARHLEQGNNHD
ncbi:MAG: hypothetical protein R3358_14355, partial [Woeseiaceae bacterium]|nr:hypothetical protein [Woeseiaceae bacterium]